MPLRAKTAYIIMLFFTFFSNVQKVTYVVLPLTPSYIRFDIINFVFVLFQAISIHAQTYECPGGWDNFQDKCYRYYSDTEKFEDAESRCGALGANGHLASIPDEQVQSFINTTY